MSDTYLDAIIMLMLLVFSAVYCAQQIRWAKEMQGKAKRMMESIEHEQRADKY